MKKISFNIEESSPREPVAYRGTNTKGLYFQDRFGQWFFLSAAGSLVQTSEFDKSDTVGYEPIYAPVTITLS
jgi:hypothetical protein